MIDLGNEMLNNGMTVRTAISGIVCKTMPTAAIASGMVSPVNFANVIERLTETYGAELLETRTFGLSKMVQFLESKGEQIGEAIVKAWREKMLILALRIAANAEQQQAA